MVNVTCDVMQPTPEPDNEHYGFACRIAGLFKDKPYCIDVWCEHDGRDCEFEPVWGAAKKAIKDADFFDVLCKQKTFMDALNADYKRFELTAARN